MILKQIIIIMQDTHTHLKERLYFTCFPLKFTDKTSELFQFFICVKH